MESINIHQVLLIYNVYMNLDILFLTVIIIFIFTDLINSNVPCYMGLKHR